MDGYGPGIPIGGGALAGKDPYKPDRAGALRARQVAVRLLRNAGASETAVILGWLPGSEAPEVVVANVDGAWWDGVDLARAMVLPDLTLASTVRELELVTVRWTETLRDGFFGRHQPWER